MYVLALTFILCLVLSEQTEYVGVKVDSLTEFTGVITQKRPNGQRISKFKIGYKTTDAGAITYIQENGGDKVGILNSCIVL